MVGQEWRVLAIWGLVLSSVMTAELPITSDWSTYNGPNGDFTTSGQDLQLVDSFKEMRLVWTSEACDLGKGKHGTSGPKECVWDKNEAMPGGYGGLVTGDGMVFVASFTPKGPVVCTSRAEYLQKNWQDQIAANGGADLNGIGVLADDRLVAMDMHTGKTKWEYRREGVNAVMFKRGGFGVTPCYHDGKVYFLTTLGEVVALDSQSGAELWVAQTGRHASLVARKALAIDQENFADRVDFRVENTPKDLPRQPSTTDQTGWLAVYKNVLVLAAGETIGFDPATGEKLWKGGPGGQKSVYVDQKRAVLIGRGKQGVSAQDIVTGKTAWTIPEIVGKNRPFVSGGMLYAGRAISQSHPLYSQLAAIPKRLSQVGVWAAWNISGDTVQPAWTSDHLLTLTKDANPQLMPATYGEQLYLPLGMLRDPVKADKDGDFLAQVAVVNTVSGTHITTITHDYTSVVQAWGDKILTRTESDGDSAFTLVQRSADGVTFTALDKRGWPSAKGFTAGYDYPVPFVYLDGFVFARIHDVGRGVVQCFDMRKKK